MKIQIRIAAVFSIATLACAAHAFTTKPTASSYLVTHKADVAASAATVYAALGQVDKWWDSRHTRSGKSANLKLEMRAGGCFCEAWDGGSVEHMHVLYALRDQGLRMEGGIDLLQDKAVTGILTFALAPEAGRTHILLTYRVRAAEAGLDATAELVDMILGEQLKGLVSYLEKK